MAKLTGNCLCGNVSFVAEGDIALQANCHCTDCQQTSGSPFATLLFMQEDKVEIKGELKSFTHTVDSGNKLRKDFCPNCGAQMFGGNEARPGSLAIKAGVINEKELIKPQFNVFAGSKVPCTILDDSIPAFEGMPS